MRAKLFSNLPSIGLLTGNCEVLYPPSTAERVFLWLTMAPVDAIDEINASKRKNRFISAVSVQIGWMDITFASTRISWWVDV